MIDPKEMKVIVIADPLVDGDRARHSYWEHMFVAGKFQEYSIADEANQWRVVNIEDADLLIVNWDCSNGDSAYMSDYTLRFFQSHGNARIRELLQRGGTLLSECQTVKGVPVRTKIKRI